MIEIMLVSDSNYSAYLATAIISILKNAASDDALRFHIVDGGLKKSDIKKIERLKTVREFESIYYRPNLKEYLKNIRYDPNFPNVVYYRLCLAKFLPESLDKVIYMDVDAIALKSLRGLWETPLDGAFVAAVPDLDIDPEHIANLELPDDHKYFNSGILLFNLKKWRDENILEQLLDVYEEISSKVLFADQDVLNVYASRTRYQELPSRWNCHPSYYDKDDTVVLHYMGIRHNLPMLDLLYDYAAQTPYGRTPIQKKRYGLKVFLKRKRNQLVCFFLFKKEWRVYFRKHFWLR